MGVVSTRRVAKNSLILYVRVMITMLITLWTTRIVLNSLGEEDYGIYNVVGGIVVLFSVISSSLSASISRFITYELGHGNLDKLQSIFKTALRIQYIIGAIILILSETVGLWFLNNEMVIPANRLIAANWVFQFSVFSFVIDLVSVPFNATIIAHERMAVYAYVGIFTAIAKLCVSLLIIYFPGRLIAYAAMILTINILVRLFYGIYCKRQFDECRKNTNKIRHDLFKEIFGFAGWNFIGATAGILNSQGVNVILNLFFGPIINAARALAIQVSGAATTFANNFMVALNPQITKSYASDEKNDSLRLVFMGSKMGFFLMLFFATPIIIETPVILKWWLNEFPPYTILFVRLVLVKALIEVLSTPLMTLMLANGNIRNYQIIVGGCNLMVLPLAYICLKLEYPPQSVFYVAIVMSLIALFLRLLLLQSMTGLNVLSYTNTVVCRIVFVTLVAFPIPCLFKYIVTIQSDILSVILTCLVSIICCIVAIYIIGLSSIERKTVNGMVKRLVHA